jgi:hypothetical protein
MVLLGNQYNIKKVTIISGFLLLVAQLLLVSPVGAIESANIGAIPANPRDDVPRSKSIFVYELKTDVAQKDGVRVINNSNSEKNILVYAVDSQRSSDGAFACAQKADEQKGLGKWTVLEKTRVTLAPNSSEVVPFTITLPKNTDVGEHNGCIAVQEDVPANDVQSNGIVLSYRSALRIAVLVPGAITSKLDFNNVLFDVTSDKVKLSPIVKNTGNVSVDATISTRLINVFGQESTKAQGTFVVLANQESRFNFELNRPFWGGWYQQKVSASYVPLRFTEEKSAQPKTSEAATRWVFVSPTPGALLLESLIVLAVFGLIGYILWRRRQHILFDKYSDVYIVETGDTLQGLAIEAGVGWRQLAKLNNIKPPYTLTPDQKIKIPGANDEVKSQSSQK